MLGEVLTAAVTPFRADGSIDLDAFSRLCAHLVDTGSDGVVVAGTTGEAPTLTDDERLALFAAAVEAVGDRATVVAGTGTYSTAHSVHLTGQAHELGVDAFLVVTPYYSKPPVRGIVEHFRAIAEETDRPVVVYNIPQRVVVNLEPETLALLAEIPNVTAVKQATADPGQARRILAETDLLLYAGNDDLLLPFLELGAAGGILVYTHVVGRQVRELVTRFREGDVAGARALDAELRPVIDALAVTTNPIPVKAALALLGHDVGGLRLPLVEATDDEKAVVRAALERVGALEVARA
ncbi:MAG TPA: 4-hydroxy-tetrahydrodipicolinate synthase [Gaiellaceae bacterium]|nr:4-hydroxy-tetrahydrodipicolinate synthase [Gaiellaceae bacterium]HXV95824.1 4-hydroxy-tetrahydrodipicolinate synthase [Gaiellaceae bacterium]